MTARSGDGTLSRCNDTVVAGSYAADIAVDGTGAWVLVSANGVIHIYACMVNANTGAVSNCFLSDGGLTNINSYQPTFQ